MAKKLDSRLSQLERRSKKQAWKGIVHLEQDRDKHDLWHYQEEILTTAEKDRRFAGYMIVQVMREHLTATFEEA